MARKQINPLDSVIMPTDEPANASLARVLGNMDTNLYQQFSQSPDQICLARQAKGFFKRVGAVLDAYFGGGDMPDYSSMEKFEREEIMDESYFFTSFYSMVFYNWDAVKKELSKHSDSPISQAFTVGGGNGEMIVACGTRLNELATPAATTIEVMKAHLTGMIAPAYTDESVGKSGYEVRKAITQLEKARNANAPKTLRSVVELERREHIALNPWGILETICITAVQKSKPVGVGKLALKNCLEATRIREMHAKRHNHSNSKTGRNVWKGGTLVEKAEYKTRAHR